MLDFSVTFGITIINIIVLAVILRAVLFKPVTRLMAERAKRVQEAIEQAEKDREESRVLLEQFQDRLKNVNAEAEAIIKDARKRADVQSQRIIADSRAMAENLVMTARKQLETEHQAALTRFKLEAAALVMAASAKLVQREFSGEDKARYVAMLLDELSAQKGKF